MISHFAISCVRWPLRLLGVSALFLVALGLVAGLLVALILLAGLPFAGVDIVVQR